jgi:hypothetical protein
MPGVECTASICATSRSPGNLTAFLPTRHPRKRVPMEETVPEAGWMHQAERRRPKCSKNAGRRASRCAGSVLVPLTATEAMQMSQVSRACCPNRSSPRRGRLQKRQVAGGSFGQQTLDKRPMRSRAARTEPAREKSNVVLRTVAPFDTTCVFFPLLSRLSWPSGSGTLDRQHSSGPRSRGDSHGIGVRHEPDLSSGASAYA